jgi:hypothetical protein
MSIVLDTQTLLWFLLVCFGTLIRAAEPIRGQPVNAEGRNMGVSVLHGLGFHQS